MFSNLQSSFQLSSYDDYKISNDEAIKYFLNYIKSNFKNLKYVKINSKIERMYLLDDHYIENNQFYISFNKHYTLIINLTYNFNKGTVDFKETVYLYYKDDPYYYKGFIKHFNQDIFSVVDLIRKEFTNYIITDKNLKIKFLLNSFIFSYDESFNEFYDSKIKNKKNYNFFKKIRNLLSKTVIKRNV